jgi:hypothetical protein
MPTKGQNLVLQCVPPPISTEASKTVVRNFYAALDVGKLDEALALLTPDYVVHPGMLQQLGAIDNNTERHHA